MLNIRVGDCEQCSEIETILSQIDQKIVVLAGYEYASIAYLAPKSCAPCLKKLLYYRNIFSNLYWNAGYYCFSYKEIISRVKSLLK